MSDERSEFVKHAAKTPGRQNVLVELLDFLRHNRKWWLLPIIAVMVLFGALILLSGTAAAPFIYTLF